MHRFTRMILGAVLSVWPIAGAAQDVDLKVAGGSDALRSELKAAISLFALADAEAVTPQALIAAAQADYGRILAALYDGGRFGPVVSITLDGREAREISPFDAPDVIDTILIDIRPGPRFRFGAATIAPLAEGTVLPDAFARGARATPTALRDAVTAGVAGWRAVGHAKARLADQQVTADHRAREVEARLRLDPGPRLRFGAIDVSTDKRVRADRILEIAGLPQGAVFDPQAITDAERRLRQTGVFSSVAVTEADTPNADGTLDLAVQVAEQKPRRFGFGAELSSQEGARLSAFWLNRNLFQGAERLRIEGEVSGIGTNADDVDYALTLTYGRPATFTPETEFYLAAGIARLNEPGFASTQAEVLSGVSHRFSDATGGSFGLGYRFLDAEDAFGDRTFQVLLATVGGSYDTRDDTLAPTRGVMAAGNVTPFVGLDDTESGVRLTSDARSYVGLGADDRFVLAGRVQIGSVWGPSLADTVPDYLFYSGGGGTVRGVPYQSLGVTLPDGALTGGQSFAALSAELRAQVSRTIGLVGFYDAGFITDESGFGGESGRHAGAGFGLRYNTGIGPIRLDVATPVTGDRAGESYELYIGIGQAF